MTPQKTHNRLKVLLVDDHPTFIETLALVLSLEPRIEIVGCAYDGEEAVTLASLTEPDVVLMDVDMPLVDGIEATRRIRRDLPSVVVLMLTASKSDEHVAGARDAGAAGYLTKDRGVTDLAHEIFRAVDAHSVAA